MPTTVGLERDVRLLLERLAALDLAAIEAYRAAIAALADPALARGLERFCEDHARHARDLAPLIRDLDGRPPTDSGGLDLMTRGQVIMAQPFGNYGILGAMLVNEGDTGIAYALAAAHDNLPEQVRPVIERALSDEQRHRAWIQTQLQNLWQAAAWWWHTTAAATDKARCASADSQ